MPESLSFVWEQDRCIGGIAAQAGDQVHAALRGQFLINRDNVPVSCWLKVNASSERVAGFDATTGKTRKLVVARVSSGCSLMRRMLSDDSGRDMEDLMLVTQRCDRCPVPALQNSGLHYRIVMNMLSRLKGPWTAEGRSIAWMVQYHTLS